MTVPPTRDYWDRYFRGLRERGDDLNWKGRWLDAFTAPLRAVGARRVLELGCGSGHDAARLARAGFAVTAVDVSTEAIKHARERHGSLATFLVVDVTQGLSFSDAQFDAVMANVSLHMFPWDVTRSVFSEIRRVVRPSGLVLFHVNAREDRPLRERRRTVVRELEPNYVLEETGQTVRFFSEEELRELLVDWRDVELQAVEIENRDTGEPFKVVWRGIARR